MRRSKHIGSLLIALALLLSLCACGKETVYTVAQNGKTYTIDTENGTVSDGAYTYGYVWSGEQVTLTYPDGSTYWWEFKEANGAGAGWGGWSEDYGPGLYVDGHDLARLLLEERSNPDCGSHILAALVLLAVGIFNMVAPHLAWELSWGWRYKNAEPSVMALVANRLSGVACIVIGVILFFV